MPRSPLTEILERVEGMVTYVQENLNPDEYDLFLDKIAPQPLPEVKKPQKKAGKKSAGGGGRASSKSARASGMAAQLGNRRQERGLATKDIAGESSNAAVCTGCDYGHDHNIHHREDTVGYHPFVSTAQSAEPQSTTDSSATVKAAAGDVHHAANSGD